MIQATENGAVELYYDNSKKLNTESWGVTVSGDIKIGNTKYLLLGDGNDFQLYHNGTDSYLQNHTGHLIIDSDSLSLRSKTGGEAYLTATVNGATKLRYDNSTKFETTSIGCKLTDSDTTAALQFVNSAGDNGYVMGESTNIIGFKDSQAHWLTKCHKDGAVELYYDNSWKFRTIANGVQTDDHICIGTSNPAGGTSSGKLCIEYNGSTDNGIKVRNTAGGTANAAVFITSSTEVGSIVITNSSTSYNTSSDYRLKENEVAISDGITRLKTLKPYRFNFKSEPSKTVDGFFAHEVTPAVPEAITGEKDGTEMQGIDQSKLVPLLTAALQEAITKIETLETKVAALESA